MGELLEFISAGRPGPAYLARPAQPGPAVLVIQEWWGLNDQIKAVADRFAGEGFYALAPDLYHGEVAQAPDQARRLAMQLALNQAADDLSGAVDLLIAESSQPRISVVGFCMGGGLTLSLAVHRSEVAAAVPFYGIPRDAAELDWSKLQAKVLGHYGEQDSGIPVSAVLELREKLRTLGKDAELRVYPDAGHAFFNEQGRNYQEKASREAWEATLRFLRQVLV